MAKWTPEQKQKHKDKARRRNYKARYPLRELLRWARQRADRKGIAFTLTESDFDHLPEFCPILNIKLNYTGSGTGRPSDSSPTLDRIDNTKGYIRDNVLICSWKANRLKGDGTAEDHRQIAEFFCRSLSANNLLHSVSSSTNQTNLLNEGEYNKS